MLDNPIWHSLCTRQAHLAISHGAARRYLPDAAPFAAVRHATESAKADLQKIVTAGDRVGILGVIPELDWPVVRAIEIYQYVWPDGKECPPEPQAIKLGEDHIPAMLELTALVYPAYFRAGTARIGDYYGIIEGGRLAAMAGIRMCMDGHQEISAICTHPDFRGRGYAGIVTRRLLNQIQSEGDVAFLHTESDNPARGMYEKMGFHLNQRLPFLIFDRHQEPAPLGALSDAETVAS